MYICLPDLLLESLVLLGILIGELLCWLILFGLACKQNELIVFIRFVWVGSSWLLVVRGQEGTNGMTR